MTAYDCPKIRPSLHFAISGINLSIMPTSTSRHVSCVPAKPLFIYDGECHFCRKWVHRLKDIVGISVEMATTQEVADKFPEISSEDFDASIQYIDANGEVFPAARGCFQALAQHPLGKILPWAYRHLPGFAALSEFIYRFIAKRRSGISKVDRAVSGLNGAVAEYTISSRIFPKALAIIFFIAFTSLFGQIKGLIGTDGISPTTSYLGFMFAHLDLMAFYDIPTIFWVNSSDFMLQAVCVIGALIAIVVFFDLAPALCFGVLWFLYLSIVNVGNVFLHYQWDALLLETGFLAIFTSPLVWRWHRKEKFSAPFLARWLMLWLLFRLIFSSGLLKIINGDASWLNLTALQYHFETQPLPSPLAFFVDQLPHWILQFAALATLFIEIVLPLFIYAPRRCQLIAAAGFILLQSLIFLTGNYGFFNLLTIALCLWLIDDVTWRKLSRIFRRRPKSVETVPAPVTLLRWRWQLLIPLSIWMAIITIPVTLFNFGLKPNWPRPITWINDLSEPFRSINNYGLFSVMTTKRYAIGIQGSGDGQTWFDYSFKWKPDYTNERQYFAQPYLPRLDFQFWFVSLSKFEQNPWFLSFCQQLLRNSPAVTSLLADNPFPDRPPNYLRVNLYEYHYNTMKSWEKTGNWWKAEFVERYSPVISLNQNR
jgi:lipase maturation factor 1